MIQLGKHFRGDDQSRHSQWLRQQKWFVKARQEQDRKEDIADKLEEEILAFAIDAVLATELQIEKFKTKLDAYDEATVKALMENQGKLDDIIRRLSEVEMRLQDMLDRAYVMEDDSGASQLFDELAGQFEREGKNIGALADKAAAREGNEAGLVAGLDPEFRPTGKQTIRDTAYDAVGKTVAIKRLRMAMRADMEGIYQTHGSDPVKLQEALAGTRQGYKKAGWPEAEAALQQEFDSSSKAYMRQSSLAAQKRQIAEHRQVATVDIEDQVRSLEQKAYGLGLDKEADNILSAGLTTLTHSIREVGADGKPLITSKAAGKLVKDMGATIVRARLTGSFSRIEKIEGKRRFIDEFEQSFASSKGIAKNLSLKQFETVQRSLRAQYRRDASQARADLEAQKKLVGQHLERAEEGFVIAPDELGLLKQVALRDGSGLDGGNEISEAAALLEWQKAARSTRPAELDQFVRKMRLHVDSGKASRYQKKMHKFSEKLLRSMRREMKGDMLGWAERAGVHVNIELDMSSPEKFQASLVERSAQSAMVSDYYGRPANVFRPHEIDGLVAMGEGGAVGMMQLSQVLVGALGKGAPAALAEIWKGKKGNAPAVAVIGGLALRGGDMQAVKDAADGMAYRKTPGFKKRLTGRLITLEVEKKLIGQVFSGVTGRTPDAIVDVARSIFETRARKEGVWGDDDEKTKALYESSMRQALGEYDRGGVTYGGVVEHNGRKVLVPPSIPQDDFSDLVSFITLRDLSGDGVPMLDSHARPLPISSLKRANLVSIGNGKYLAALGDVGSDDPQFIAGDGEDGLFVLDMNKLGPKLQERKKNRGFEIPVPFTGLSVGFGEAKGKAQYDFSDFRELFTDFFVSPAAAAEFGDGVSAGDTQADGDPSSEFEPDTGDWVIDDFMQELRPAEEFGKRLQTDAHDLLAQIEKDQPTDGNLRVIIPYLYEEKKKPTANGGLEEDYVFGGERFFGRRLSKKEVLEKLQSLSSFELRQLLLELEGVVDK